MKIISIMRFYGKELKTITLLAIGIAALIAFIRYRGVISDNIFSEKGITILMGIAIAGVAGTVVRIYYRVIVIKYSPKVTKGQ